MMAGYQDDDVNEPGEAMEGEGCRPSSGNDANVAVGQTRNGRPDTKATSKAGRSTKGALFH